MDPAYQDLGRIDRDVARASASLAKWRKELARDVEAAAARDPLEAFRHVAGRAAYLELLGPEDRPKGADTPLREALARWVAHLTLARIALDLEVDAARIAAAPEAVHALTEGRRVSYREALRELPRALTRVELDAWLAAAAERAGAVGAPLRERRARREEAAARLGAAGTWALASKVPAPAVLAACEALLKETRTVATDLRKEARAKDDGPSHAPPSAWVALTVGVARAAPEGWPARLQTRWLVDLFPQLIAGLRLDVGALPAALGASSFARALAAFGFAFRAAGPAPSLPFALASDPSPVDAHRYAAVFGALSASPEFQRRALGNVARVAAAQARTMARSLLLTARFTAARALLARDPGRFEELMVDVFGAALPDALALAWPAPRDDEPARVIALLTALPLARELVDRFDADWFRNPRGALYLRARASAPMWEERAELEPGCARELARAFEGAVA